MQCSTAAPKRFSLKCRQPIARVETLLPSLSYAIQLLKLGSLDKVLGAAKVLCLLKSLQQEYELTSNVQVTGHR